MPTSALWEIANLPQISVKTVQSAWVDVGIDPYRPEGKCYAYRKNFRCSDSRRGLQMAMTMSIRPSTIPATIG